MTQTLSPVRTTARTMARIVGLGTAVPAFSYSQQELLDIFSIEDPRIRSVFLNSAIERRFLTLPPELPDGTRHMESQGELLRKHREHGIDMGARALQSCLKEADASLEDVRYLCCVTSTGFLTPGLSARLIKELGLQHHTSRLDVVGMGCNAGLNGLGAVAGWAGAHPGELAVMVCVEACSAAYVFDGTMRTSVVNSLFGDGAAAVALVADADGETGTDTGTGTDTDRSGPSVLKFASCVIPEAIEAMRYDWDDEEGKFSFFLDRDVPYVVGAHAESVVDRLLSGTGLRRSDVAHWIVHSGGKKVIDSVMVNLGLTRHDVRHTTGVLRDYGNLSSGSFLFSYGRLLEEEVVRAGDYGIFMTMGPGSTIETALVRY
ncbi:3,5-dihydroxyphenylacetyl-CoA synthase DpgA [Streptomyces sp. UNOB3_S3]|uniref:3,5-dihydroxyphenylacetyl-CoA synthase DpgA n=1 Tax=Streptomyces sp. UNOB3_S3 TaxID=2871682 RepID=UPI001E4D1397|nr:3,5-dihydroxyphenylacetyl-CoA synthase DpgA [Streptomyces sp. UNOB3_S3]MCC3775016.1 type III polyketide synthase [Streptomyces sp. UNOB3_S3]